MEDQIERYQTEISLLRKLINEDYEERETISKDLHYKKGSLVDLNYKFEILESKALKENVKLDLIQDQKSIVRKVIEDLSDLENVIHDKRLQHLGLAKILKQFLYENDERYNSFTTFISNGEIKNNLSKSMEFGIYKICIEIMNFLYSQNVIESKLGLNYTSTKLDLDISVETSSNKKIDQKIEFEKIQGLIVWQQGIISPDTNWRDKIRISFNLLSE